MRAPGFPFRPTLIALVVLVLAVGTGGVSLSSYWSARQLAGLLWSDLSAHLSREAMHQTLRFLEPAVPYVEESRRQVALGALDVSDDKALLRHLRAALDAHPTFNWASFGRADGVFFTVNHANPDELATEIRRTPAGPGPTRVEHYRWEGREPVLDHTSESDYRVLERPWYTVAQGDDAGHWGRPYLFASNKHPGFIYSARQSLNGQLQGVWTVDWELVHLDHFLAQLKVVQRGRVYLLTPEGDVVGHPDGHTVLTDAKGEPRLATVADQPDLLLRQLYQQWQAQGGGAQRLAVGSQLAVVEPFPAELGIPWAVLVSVPEAVIFGEASRQLEHNLAIAAIAGLLALLLGVLLSTRVSAALVDLALAAERVGQFDLGEQPLLADRSRVREVKAMATAFQAMKASLRSFAKYVPSQVVGELVKSGREARLGGTKSELSVLFSDIAGFTSISERMAPDALVEALGGFLQGASAAVMDHGGTVDKFIGDAVMAFWGAPQAQADHALRACRAALALQRSADALAGQAEARGQPPFRARIGINTGPALVGNIGAPDRLNYTAMGDAVNVASRLEGLNKAYGTRLLLGQGTAELVRGQLELRLLDWVAVKGRGQAMAVYELLGEKGQVPAEQLAQAARYQAALEAYRARRFEEAAAAFGALAAEGDAPAQHLAERARAFAAAPPPPGWDGAHVMESK